MPLVGAEVQRINAAFHTVSQELGGVLTVLRDLDVGSVGTPAADPAVSEGVADLRKALAGLQSTADSCVQAMGRHAELTPETTVTEAEGDA